jgi:flagellar export protein FliJ
MPRFRFQLQPVLEQRRRAEERCQLVVADLERQRLEIERAIRGFQDGIVRERLELRRVLGAGAGAVPLRDARMQAAAGASLDMRARQEVLRLAGLCKRLEAARSELLAAAAARKAVELLRDRRLEAWRHEQSRLEAAAVDELAVMSAARKEELP